MRAVDLYAWLALSGLEALFYGLLGAAVPLLRRLPGLARLGGGRVDGDGGAAQRVAVQRDAVGPAGLRRRGHPGGAARWRTSARPA